MVIVFCAIFCHCLEFFLLLSCHIFHFFSSRNLYLVSLFTLMWLLFLSIFRSDVTKSQVSLAKGQNSPAQPATPETQKKRDPATVFAMISGTGEWSFEGEDVQIESKKKTEIVFMVFPYSMLTLFIFWNLLAA